MTTTNPTLLTTPLAENGNKNTIPATQAAAGNGLMSQSTGFPPETALPLGAGGIAPSREDFNGAFNLLGGIAFYSQKGWFYYYDDNQTYFKGCVVRDLVNDRLYECLDDIAAGGGNPSEDDGTNWREFATGGVPLGTILPYSTNAAEPPYSFLFCEGQAVSRTMYPDLFALIGTTYGAGDGSTTFNLPNMLDRYPQGSSTAGTVKSAGLPNIEGEQVSGMAVNANGDAIGSRNISSSGAITDERQGKVYYSTAIASTALTTNAYGRNIRIDASLSNPIYGNSDTVTPPTLTVRWIIKAYDAPTPSSAQIDLSQYASDLANRLTREQTPAFNRRDVITTSGTYTAPVTGWYKITVKGGGGGGGGGYYSSSYAIGGSGGGEGGLSIGYEKMTAGQTASVVIGAGGAGGVAQTGSGATGGNTTVTANNNTYTGSGGGGGASQNTSQGGAGGAGDIPGAAGGACITTTAGYAVGNSGGGNGGGVGVYNSTGTAGTIGGGGGGGFSNKTYSTSSAGGAGGDGYAEFSYFDPSLN